MIRRFNQPNSYFCGHMNTIWLRMLKRVQTAHRRGGFTGVSPFFGVFSNCHTWKVTDDPYLQLPAVLCICPWAVIDRVPSIPRNTRGGDSTAVEKLDWWSYKRRPTSPIQGTSSRVRPTRERWDAMKTRAALSEGGTAGCRQGDWVSPQLVAWC